jgi:rRNA maturation endonuclease Nob1
MPFAPSDFEKYGIELRMIAFAENDIDILADFKTLTKRQQKKTNDFLNSYIKALPNDDWEMKIHADFKLDCSELFDDLHVRAGKMRIRAPTASEIENSNDDFKAALGLTNLTETIINEFDQQKNNVTEKEINGFTNSADS